MHQDLAGHLGSHRHARDRREAQPRARRGARPVGSRVPDRDPPRLKRAEGPARRGPRRLRAAALPVGAHADPAGQTEGPAAPVGMGQRHEPVALNVGDARRLRALSRAGCRRATTSCCRGFRPPWNHGWSAARLSATPRRAPSHPPPGRATVRGAACGSAPGRGWREARGRRPWREGSRYRTAAPRRSRVRPSCCVPTARASRARAPSCPMSDRGANGGPAPRPVRFLLVRWPRPRPPGSPASPRLGGPDDCRKGRRTGGVAASSGRDLLEARPERWAPRAGRPAAPVGLSRGDEAGCGRGWRDSLARARRRR